MLDFQLRKISDHGQQSTVDSKQSTLNTQQTSMTYIIVIQAFPIYLYELPHFIQTKTKDHERNSNKMV